MKPKLLGLSLAGSALLATVANAEVKSEQLGERITVPSGTVIQKAQLTPSTLAQADDSSPNHDSHASHDSHSSHYSSADGG
jgi:hypothetical protein